MAEIAYSLPLPSYVVGYNYTLIAGGWGAVTPGSSLLIPNKHRRAGDTSDNRVISYQLSWAALTTGTTIYAYDDESNPCMVIEASNQPTSVLFTQDSPLKLGCTSWNVNVYILAKYALPIPL